MCHSYTHFLLIFRTIIVLALSIHCGCGNELQPCPDNPIVIEARATPKYIFSPYDENKNYPPNTDCQFVIKASSLNHRIHLSVLESELEEPLFGECNDYIGIWDGNDNSSKEVARWCGSNHPSFISSAESLLLVRFHSDSVVHKHGFNFSFVEFELPGCPPDWTESSVHSSCYKQFMLPYVLPMPWLDAQRECNYERGNLITFTDQTEYLFVYKNFSQTHTYPWIGYSDTGTEGVFETVDRSQVWPNPFPPLEQQLDFKDCVFLDWSKRDQVAYEIDDCRTRKAYICKRKTDGSTIPIAMAARLVRRGFSESENSNFVLIVILVAILIALVITLIACLLFYKYKEGTARVSTVDLNQRFVQGIDVKQSEVNIHPQHQPQKPISMSPRPSAKAKEQQQHRIRKDRTPPLHIERESSLTMMTNFPISFDRTIAQFESEAAQRRSTYIQQQPNRESSLDFGSPRIKMEPNQPGIGMARYGASRYEVENNGYEPDDSDGSGGGRRKGEAVTAVEIDKKTKDHHRGEASLEHHRDEDDGMIKWASPTLAKTKFMQQFTTFSVQREGTQTTMNSGGTSGSRIKAKRRSFERPPNVTTLDSVSAISLDDFWQK